MHSRFSLTPKLVASYVVVAAVVAALTCGAAIRQGASVDGLTVGLVLAGIAVALVAGWFVARRIRGCVVATADVLEAVAAGDLTKRVDYLSGSELGRMAASLNATVEGVAARLDEGRKSIENVNNLPTPIMTIDRDFNITFLNRAGADVVGLTQEQAVGRKCYDLFKTPHCRTAECRCAQAMERARACTGETVAHPNGHTVPITYTAAPVTDAAGRIVGALEYVVDMTESRKALETAQQSVDNLNNLPTPVMTIDRDFTVTFLNPAGAKAVGTTPEAAVGRKCYELFKTPHCRTPECRCTQAMETGRNCQGETVVDPQGINLPILYSGSPVKDAAGNVIGALEYVIDIAVVQQSEVVQKAKRVADKITCYQDGEVEKISTVMQQVAAGDLTRRYDVAEADEDTQAVGESFRTIAVAMNDTIRNLGELIGQVTEIAAQFGEGSRVVAESSQTLAQGAQSQSSTRRADQRVDRGAQPGRSRRVKENAARAPTRWPRGPTRLAERGGARRAASPSRRWS